ncbi:MAG: hypothetical protein WC107_07610 [Patescibacteria group bacterium]
MRFYVYAHEFASGPNATRPFYIGKGSGRRAWNVSTRSKYWKSLVNKYGVVVRIIDSGISESQAFELEKFLIETIGRDNLCNFTDGGEGMANPSETVRARLSASHIGKTHTDEQKLKISLAGMGRKLSAAHRESLRLSRVGAVASHETRTRISQSRIGRGPSEELRAKTGRAVKCNNDMTFGSVGLAVDWLVSIGNAKAQKTPIVSACKGSRKTAYGFSWEFISK